MHEMHYDTLQKLFTLEYKRNILRNINILACPGILKWELDDPDTWDTYPHPTAKWSPYPTSIFQSKLPQFDQHMQIWLITRQIL